MAGVSLTFYLSHIFLIYGVSEFYYTKYLTTPFYLVKKSFLTIKSNNELINANVNKLIYCMFIQLIASLSWKLTKTMYIFQLLSLHHYIIFLNIIVFTTLLFVKTYLKNNNYILWIWLLVVVNFFYYTNNLLVFILVLEIIATIYYFFFLNTIESETYSLIKLKNLIINYLWLSLLTLLFFCYTIIFLIQNVGTLDFYELQLFTSNINSIAGMLFLISLFWKIGLPGFHFFKYEIYRYLPLLTIFYFSLFSIMINIYILLFVVVKLPILFFSAKYFLILFILLSNILLVLQGIDNVKLFQFLALSGLNTITTILLFILL